MKVKLPKECWLQPLWDLELWDLKKKKTLLHQVRALTELNSNSTDPRRNLFCSELVTDKDGVENSLFGQTDGVHVLQVYSWGSNMCGQLGHVSSSFIVPQQAKVRLFSDFSDVWIRTILCCGFKTPHPDFNWGTVAVWWPSGLGHVCRSEPLPPPGWWRLHPACVVVLWPAERKVLPEVPQQSREVHSQAHPAACLPGGMYEPNERQEKGD